VSEQIEVLADFVSRLESARVPYMVSGSMAMNYYAQPRMTRDIDVVVEVGLEAAGKLEELLQEDYYVDADAIRAAVRRRGMFNVIHLGHMVKVDCILRKGTVYRRLEFSRRRRVSVSGVGFWIVSPEDLLLSKLHWARHSRSELQLGDARNLIRSVPDLDWEHAEKWARRLKVSDLLDQVRH
jgi:hypothetical protein